MADTLTHCPRCLTGKLFERDEIPFGLVVYCIACGFDPGQPKPLPLVNPGWTPARRIAAEAVRRSA